jgi:two-component sensor histidine kinase/streptogramin lyase
MHCLNVLNAIAQTDYRYTSYSRENGLITSTVTAIAKDSMGFLWLMSENGLTRFDGYDFKVFRPDPKGESGLLSPLTDALFIDENKRMFFKTRNSISRYFPSTKTFKKIINYKNSDYFVTWINGTPNSWFCVKKNLVYIEPETDKLTYVPFPKNFSLNNEVYTLLYRNHIYISDGITMYRFHITTKKFYKVEVQSATFQNRKNVNKPVLFFVNTQNLPVFVSHESCFKYDTTSNSFIEYYRHNLNMVSGYNPISKLVKENRYAVFLRKGGKLDVLDTENKTLKTIWLHAETKLDTLVSSGLFAGKGNYLWATGISSGVFKVNYSTGETTQYISGKTPGFPINTSNYIVDEGDVVFYSMPGTGFLKGERNAKLFQPYSLIQINNNNVSFLKDNVRKIFELNEETFLVLTLEGVYTFNHQKKTFDDLRSPVDGKPVLKYGAFSDAAYDKQGNLYITSWGGAGIYVLNYRLKKMSLINLLRDSITNETYSIRCAYLDSLGYLWMGTGQNSILRINTNNFSFNSASSTHVEYINAALQTGASLTFNIVFDINANSSSQLFFCTQNGLFKYDYSTQNFSNFIKDNSSVLYNMDVRALVFDNENVWVGTNGSGLHLLNKNGILINSYHVADGLPDEIIYSIEKDLKGLLWMGTNKGLTRFNPETKSIKSYTLRDGVQNYEFNTNSSISTLNGLMVFGGIGGFNCFYPDLITQEHGIQNVIITEIKVGMNESAISDKPLLLKYDENNLSFQFSSLNFYRNEETQYAYMLEGLEKEWVFSGNRRFTNYINIPSGCYTFKVRASNHAGQWDDNYATVIFSIETAWYNTWWFRVLLIAFGVGVVYLIFVIRLNQKLRVQEIRNNIARDLHDEVGSNLSSIALFTAVAKEKTVSGKEGVEALLKKIGDYTQISQESMNDIVWMINSINDNFENIIIRLRAIASEMCEAKNILMHLNVPEKINEVKLDMNKRKNFYLIFKEATNNIVKYSDCKNIWITVKHKNGDIVLEIRDDGKGFDTTVKYAGNGLINIHKRAELLKGKIDINSAPGVGTSFNLSFKA